MAKWVLIEHQGSWCIKRNGRTKATPTNESNRDTWLRNHCQAGDKIFLEEPDGFLRNVTKQLLKRSNS